jgi:hypothetical protein
MAERKPGWIGIAALIGVLAGGLCLVLCVQRFCEVSPLDVPLVEGRQVTLHGPRNSGFFVVFNKALIGRVSLTPNLPSGSTVLMTRPGSPREVRFQLDGYKQSIGGFWRGVDGRVRCVGALDGEFEALPGNRGKTPPLFRLKEKWRWISPYLVVSLPLDRVSLELPLDRRRVHLRVQLALDLSGETSRTGFMNGPVLQHDLSVILLSDQETAAYKAARWRYRLVEGGPLVLATLGVGFVTVATYVIARRKNIFGKPNF